MEQVRLGIIGVGNMGSGHTANIMAGKVPEVRITAAADLRESRREWAKENMPEGTAIFEDGDSLIKSGTCDAVLIAVPHYDHPRLTILAHLAKMRPEIFLQLLSVQWSAFRAADRIYFRLQIF